MIRQIDAFHQDDAGDWVAELSCLHNQHVRHRPPLFDRPWVLTAAGREERIGADIDCPLCDRAELPEGLARVRTAGPFDETTLPPGLRRDHRVAERTWGLVRVLEGSIVFEMATSPPMSRALSAGDSQAIPPQVPHHVVLTGAMRIEVDFLARDGP